MGINRVLLTPSSSWIGVSTAILPTPSSTSRPLSAGMLLTSASISSWTPMATSLPPSLSIVTTSGSGSGHCSDENAWRKSPCSCRVNRPITSIIILYWKITPGEFRGTLVKVSGTGSSNSSATSIATRLVHSAHFSPHQASVVEVIDQILDSFPRAHQSHCQVAQRNNSGSDYSIMAILTPGIILPGQGCWVMAPKDVPLLVKEVIPAP
ncbi:hypothetical protein DPMN_174600 [Dreissena polymorpha]|uniref:Uncharacterized protein n=1 Tax=Dreissena polymorpha TaxID=45954 RepID=A0A9D4II02_DREPO|nr:hypothetical protein DPMN_174600 [Dreissena polymorpha]